MVSFEAQKLLILTNFNLSLFLFFVSTFDVILKKLLLNTLSERFTPVLHFELIFIYGMR